MEICLSFSGGLDSTYILWKLLTETQHDIVAVFFDQRFLTPDTGAWRGEPHLAPYQDFATNAIAKWCCAEIREFTLERKTLRELSPGQNFCMYFSEWAAAAANESFADKFIHGSSGLYTNRTVEAKQRFKNVATRGELWFPLATWGKQTGHMFLEMPEELVALTTSCHRPRFDVQGKMIFCETCPKCDRNKIVRGALADGHSAQSAIEIYKKSDSCLNFRAFHDTREAEIGIYGD